VLDVGDLVVMPGIIDPHVHTCEPGHTASEGYSSATKAAAAGGVTTLVAMPLSCLPPATALANFDKLQSAEGQCRVDVAFWGGVVPGNHDELLSMLQAGVPGFKCSLIASGVEEFPHVSLQDLHMAMNGQGTHRHPTTPMNAQTFCTSGCKPDSISFSGVCADPTEYRALLDSCPDAMEVEAVQTIPDLCL
ncbi:unnamed protein product, partial [Lepidochelys kempii]